MNSVVSAPSVSSFRLPLSFWLLGYPHLQNPRRFAREGGAVSGRPSPEIQSPLPGAHRPCHLPGKWQKTEKAEKAGSAEKAPIRRRTVQPRRIHRQPARQTPTDGRPAAADPWTRQASRRQQNGRQPAQTAPAASKTAHRRASRKSLPPMRAKSAAASKARLPTADGQPAPTFCRSP